MLCNVNTFIKSTSIHTLALLPLFGCLLVGCVSGPDAIDLTYGGGMFAEKAAFVDDFNPGWSENQTDWDVATWEQNNTQMSPERCQDNGEGMLVQTVLAGEPYLGGSMQSRTEFGYGRWVARIKPSSVPKLLNSMFTKDWDDYTTPKTKGDGNKYEVDIEFLTKTFGENTGEIHMALHGVKGNFYNNDMKLDFNPSDEFHVWGFDILPSAIVWHLDGKEINRYTETDGKVEPGNYEMFFNSWTHPRWVEGPPAEKAEYNIDWVRFYPLETEVPAKE